MRRRDITYLTIVGLLLFTGLTRVLYAEQTPSQNQLGQAVSQASTETKAENEDSYAVRMTVSPLFGTIQPLERNNYLENKFTAGVASGIRLSNHISVEGQFTYAQFKLPGGFYYWGGNFHSPRSLIQGSYIGIPFGGISYLKDMSQFMAGGDLAYQLFPKSFITPYVGGGLSWIQNRYNGINSFTAGRVTVNQNLMAVDAMLGLKLRVTRNLSLDGRGQLFTLVNNRNRYGYYDVNDFRANTEFFRAMAGLTFEM